MSNDPRFMRFVVRPGCKGGIVGFNINLFEEGVVYEITESFDGEYTVKKLGPSPLGLPLGRFRGQSFNFHNGLDYNRLYTEGGGSIVRTIAEHEWEGLVAARKVVQAAQDVPACGLVRVDFGDETSWAELVEGSVYMSTNNTLSNVELRVPKEHPEFTKNGMKVNMKWGHFFEAQPLRVDVVQPLFIIGHFGEVTCAHNNGEGSKLCHRCKRYSSLINKQHRTDEEEAKMLELREWLKAHGKDPSVPA